MRRGEFVEPRPSSLSLEQLPEEERPHDSPGPSHRARKFLAVTGWAAERVRRHLDSNQFLTYLQAQPPLAESPTCGLRQVRPPWAEPRARFM
jgi:hypothetical protein